jgi:hypothetical protein
LLIDASRRGELAVLTFFHRQICKSFCLESRSQVAILFRVCQVIALVISLMPLYLQDAWALTETPGGTVNAWEVAGQMIVDTGEPGLIAQTEYCSNAKMTYVKGAREFPTPECRALLPVEIAERRAVPPSVFYTTAYTETVTVGWPCANDANRTRQAECKAGGGASFGRGNGQCGCVTTSAVYPLAVERMNLAFEHSFSVPDSKLAAVTNWLGSSANKDGSAGGAGAGGAAAEEEGLWSDVSLGNGSTLRFDAGVPIELSVEQWLRSANVSLGDANHAVHPDAVGNLAPQRTTGVTIRVDIVYSNVDPLTRRAVAGKRTVHANVRLTRELSTWTGLSKESVWVVAPGRPRSVPSDFHLVERARQGILFNFNCTGQVFVLDMMAIVSVLITALVTMNLARMVADAYAFYLLPGGKSTVLRNKRQELVSKRSEFAEIGMKAALAASVYRSFDPDNNGSIEPVDIVRAFASVYKVRRPPPNPHRVLLLSRPRSRTAPALLPHCSRTAPAA